MSDNENKRAHQMKSAITENDNINETFVYENALKNLQREIEEKQEMLSKLQVKINPDLFIGNTAAAYQKNADDEYDYLKNKNAVQRIKDEAADVLIGELKNITSNLKRKLSDIDEKEKRISYRLIELEERQSILEEIDYVQRMIPKKIIDDNINKSVQTKQELDIDIGDMFMPAAKVIADKTTKKLPEDIKLADIEEPANEDKPATGQKQFIEENIESKPQRKISQDLIIESKPKQEIKIKVPVDVKEQVKEEPVIIKRQAKEQPENIKNEMRPRRPEKAEEKKVIQEPKNTYDKKIIMQEEPYNIKVPQNIKPREEKIKRNTSKETPAQRSSIIQSRPSAVSAFARDAKSKKSVTSKPERKGMYMQQRNWKNFAYIKDSKVKLKQDDLLSISKTIMDIEQGKLSLKGI